MYICKYVKIYICIFDICIYVYLYICTYVYTYLCIYILTYLHLYIYIHISRYVYTHIRIYDNICIHVNTNISFISFISYVSSYLCICMFNMHALVGNFQELVFSASTLRLCEFTGDMLRANGNLATRTNIGGLMVVDGG